MERRPSRQPDSYLDPAFSPGYPIAQNTERTLAAIVDWVESDGLVRTRDELISEVMVELGFERRVRNLVGAISAAMLPYLMVFYAEFGGREQRIASNGATQGPITETLLAYAVAFIVSAAMLAMFGRVDTVNGAATARVVTLAFPASIGAALGRLLI